MSPFLQQYISLHIEEGHSMGNKEIKCTVEESLLIFLAHSLALQRFYLSFRFSLRCRLLFVFLLVSRRPRHKDQGLAMLGDVQTQNKSMPPFPKEPTIYSGSRGHTTSPLHSSIPRAPNLGCRPEL